MTELERMEVFVSILKLSFTVLQDYCTELLEALQLIVGLTASHTAAAVL